MVRLTCETRSLELIVEDRGRGVPGQLAGFEPRASRSRPTTGITSMRERAALVGGTLDLESPPSGGPASGCGYQQVITNRDSQLTIHDEAS